MNGSPPATTLEPPAAPARPARSVGFNLASVTALYTLTLRQHLHGRRWLFLGVLFLAPALLAGLVRALSPDVSPRQMEFLFVYMLVPQALLPLVALLYGSGIIRDEQEEQTFTYLLIRPIPRWAIFVLKLLATLTTVVVLTCTFTALTFVVIYPGTDVGGAEASVRCLKTMAFHSLAVCAYCCLFAVISLLTRWTLLLGFLYTALIELLLANLPFSIRLFTVTYYTRILAYRSMDFVIHRRTFTVDLADHAWQLDAKESPTLANHPSFATALTVLLVGCLVATLLGAYLCSRREFYVKTPEGS